MNIKFLNDIGYQIKKHSPEILMWIGIAGTVGSTVIACKATSKAKKTLEEHNSTIASIKSIEADPMTTEDDKKALKKDVTKTYLNTTKEIAKIYGPSILLGGASIASILGGHRIISKRYASMSAAYVALDSTFSGYRKKVAAKLGEQVEKELRYDIKKEKIDTGERDENGKKVKKEVQTIGDNPSYISPYARFFDELSPYWRKDAEANLMFLRGAQDAMNEKLKRNGHLYLNDVYQALGLQESHIKNRAGWIYDKNSEGDNYVDFGIYEQIGNPTHDEPKRAFVNGLEKSILLDFNCVPDIYADYAGGLS